MERRPLFLLGVGVSVLFVRAGDAAVYEATLTGAFTAIDFDGADPGSFVSLSPGDTYVFTLTADPTAHPVPTGDVLYDILSISLTIDDGVTVRSIPPSGDGIIGVSWIPNDACVFGLRHGIDGAPFQSVRLGLVDNDGDPVLPSTDLPLSLDLNAFTDQRDFALVGQVGTGAESLYPTAFATVDTFFAHLIPSPGAPLLLLLGAAPPARRRR